MSMNIGNYSNTSSIEDGEKIVAAIGRWMPIHNGHKNFLVNLAKDKQYKKLIVMIGSTYEGGTIRYCITATEREKMIRSIFKKEGISEERYEIIPVEDTYSFDEWIENILSICYQKGVTHFCTGNQKDILDVLERKNKKLDMELINPETNSNFPYHASDIRKLIVQGEYEEVDKLIPTEIKPILFRYTFKEILAASQGNGISFIPGRQTVDVVLLLKNTVDGKIYILLGKRPAEKKDFPNTLALPGGGIEKFETATNAAIRKFYDETGIEIKMLDNSLEPAIIKFENIPNSNLEQMFMIGIYGSNDKSLNGSQGGSSQCFGIFLEDDLPKYEAFIEPIEGLEDVKFYDIEKLPKLELAFQHHDMVQKALTMFKAYPDYLEKSNSTSIKRDVKETYLISFVGASGVGKSTAALGTAYELKKRAVSVEYVDEFAKGLVYTDSLERYIPNQTYIIAEQHKKIYDLLGQVDYIVSDAGLEISALHASNEKVIEDLAWHLTKQINQVTILIERDTERVKFEKEGRLESEAESKAFGERLEEYLKANKANYIKVIGSEAAVNAALQIVSARERGKKNAK